MFPIRNARGQIIGFGGRVLDSGEPKYLNSPETPIFRKGQELYGLFEAKRNPGKPNEIIVVEGYLDVASLVQFGVENVVATLGTACCCPRRTIPTRSCAAEAPTRSARSPRPLCRCPSSW